MEAETLGGEIPMKMPEVAPAPVATEDQQGRRLYITKKMVKQFGASAGCPGCTTVGALHTEACRKRISDKIAEDPGEAWRLREVEFRNEGKKARISEGAPSRAPAPAAAAAQTAASSSSAAAHAAAAHSSSAAGSSGDAVMKPEPPKEDTAMRLADKADGPTEMTRWSHPDLADKHSHRRRRSSG